jgi:hypothetical protein
MSPKALIARICLGFRKTIAKLSFRTADCPSELRRIMSINSLGARLESPPGLHDVTCFQALVEDKSCIFSGNTHCLQGLDLITVQMFTVLRGTSLCGLIAGLFLRTSISPLPMIFLEK